MPDTCLQLYLPLFPLLSAGDERTYKRSHFTIIKSVRSIIKHETEARAIRWQLMHPLVWLRAKDHQGHVCSVFLQRPLEHRDISMRFNVSLNVNSKPSKLTEEESRHHHVYLVILGEIIHLKPLKWLKCSTAISCNPTLLFLKHLI